MTDPQLIASLPEFIIPKLPKSQMPHLPTLINWVKGHVDIVGVWLEGGVFDSTRKALVLVDDDSSGAGRRTGVAEGWEIECVSARSLQMAIDVADGRVLDFLAKGYRLCGVDDVVFELEAYALARVRENV